MDDIATDLSAVSQVRVETPRWLAVPLLLALFLITWASTGPHFMADTSVYTAAILVHQHDLPADDYHRLTSNPFWEFGHLLWRPFGWLCFAMAKPVVGWYLHGNETAEVIWTLIGIDFLSAAACVFFFFLLAMRIVENDCAAALATVALIFSDAFLNYSHTGNAYPVGLACLVAGMYVSVSGAERAASWGRAWLAGLMLALAVLFWFPYIFVLPAVFAAPLLLYGRDRRRLGWSGVTVGACAIVGISAYASAIAILGVHHIADIKAWIMAASHGQIRQGGLRAGARLLFSVPRSFINMGRDGMWVKRYLVHDPYAPVTVGQLFRLSLWKLVLFYVAAGVVFLVLLRSARGRTLLLLLAAAGLPIVVFGLVLFESGSIERYLPLYPFVFLAFGYALASAKPRAYARPVLLSVLVVALIVNFSAMRRSTLETERGDALARIQELMPELAPNSLVMAVNEQDNLALFQQNFPLDPISLERKLQSYDVLQTGVARLETWREDFATRVLWTWKRGGTVWLPLRFLHDRPDPKWNWVEGDDRRVRWTDLPEFFSEFRLGRAVGGDDGFVALTDVPENRQKIVELIRKLPKQ